MSVINQRAVGIFNSMSYYPGDSRYKVEMSEDYEYTPVPENVWNMELTNDDRVLVSVPSVFKNGQYCRTLVLIHSNTIGDVYDTFKLHYNKMVTILGEDVDTGSLYSDGVQLKYMKSIRKYVVVELLNNRL